eukprot:scaffold2634_cov98-Skeletonema_dohrnii-CCMP3373.AAC.3
MLHESAGASATQAGCEAAPHHEGRERKIATKENTDHVVLLDALQQPNAAKLHARRVVHSSGA